MPFKTPFIWLVWASKVKDDTLYTLGKNIALERKIQLMGKSWEEFVCVGILREKRTNRTFPNDFALFFTFFQTFLCIWCKLYTFALI